MSKVAVVQVAPKVLDREATLAAAVEWIGRAAAEGARLIVFPETYVPCYPAWIWRLRPGTDAATIAMLHARLLDNAVQVRRGDLAPLYAAAKRHEVTVVCGINERDEDGSGGTIYNAVVVIGPDGTLLHKHRKLMPTNPERTVWGFGDGSTLKTIDTPCGRLGALICWENYMPLARYALYAQGIDLYVAPTYDSGDDWIGTLQHIAREACCWVIGSGTLLRASDLPTDITSLSAAYPEAGEWINDGDSVVIAPNGKVVAGPLRREEGILYAEIDVAQVGAARRRLDVVGHYSRPDVFRLHVNRTPQSPVSFD
ncbi:MAG TPA: carbon-nitrogen hydrolase family protein [Casimicrobiaceae bacterium]|nr:carbon-nitrogen hydrolase family protein [Casimicrobiaceae bacterium]